MKKPMLNAIQKVKMSMAMKSKNPKMNPGFDSLPKEVQNKIMKKKAKLSMKKKPKMAMKKPKVGMKKVPKGDMTMPKMAMKKPAMMGMKKPKASSKTKKVAKKVTDTMMDMATGGLTAIKGLGGQRLKNYKNRKLGLGVTIKEAFADRDKKKYPNTPEGKKKFEKDARAYLKSKKPKMAMKKPKLKQPSAADLKKGSRKSKRALKKFDKQYKKLAKRAGMSSQKKAKMTMKKKPKMAMKKAKASQTAGAIMKRERMMN